MKNEKEKIKNKKPTELLRTPDFRRTYANGTMVGYNDYDFRVMFINEVLDIGDKRVLETNAQTILSPKAAKEFTLIMSKKVEEYEKKYGKISIKKKN